MDIENLIKDTFTEHEHVVPDADTVRAAARQRIDRGRTVNRPLAVAAGVAVLSLAVAGVVALNRPGAADKDQAAGPAPVSDTATAPAAGDLTMPYSLDWVPPGEIDYLARRTTIGSATEDPDTPLYGGEYMFSVTNNGQVLDVDVQQMRMVSVDEAAFKSGPGNPVTINGQNGVESAVSDGPGGYELYVAHPDGGSMYVNVSAGSGSTAPPTQQLVDIGHQVAQNIRFPGTTTVTPPYGLRDLPDGMKICAFSVDEPRDGAGINTSYSLGTCDTMPPIHVYVPADPAPNGTPGQPVQGHETRYVDENGYRTLQVLDAVKGVPVNVAGKVAMTDLYDIANRLVLPS
jgi:hypothetical protein